MLEVQLETELVVASESLLRKHPLLYHYTDAGGFQGILSNDTLWATHYADLNDTTELMVLRDPLTRAIIETFSQILRNKARASLRIKRAVEKGGGLAACAASVASDLVKALYEVSVERVDGSNLAEPYITSFCTHAEEYEQNNGLLSQWRGYGGTGGYCIIFDTEKLSRLLSTEQDSNYYLIGNIDEVIYSHEETNINAAFPNLISRCNAFFDGILEGRDLKVPISDGFVPFIKGATLFKHQGFREEAEVRLIAIPGSEHAAALVRREHPTYPFGPIKEIRRREAPGGSLKRYVVLFDGLTEPLPITRVIVGPSRHQEENVNWARGLLGSDVDVVPSETPYLPPA